MLLLSSPDDYRNKEETYLAVRGAEGRIHTDAALGQLPEVAPGHHYEGEWRQRRMSLRRLLAHLAKHYPGRKLRVLDIGCGNGWMSHRLAEAGHAVTGVDLNLEELAQAERVFGSSDSLQWAFADVLKDDLPGAPFDIIILAASCQYFPDLQELTTRLMPWLSPRGGLHLLDSMSYADASAQAAARQRTLDYYAGLGFPQMSAYYFHHLTGSFRAAGFHQLKPPLPDRLRRNAGLQWWVKRRG